MERDVVERENERGAAGDEPDASLPPACPRFATREEWEAWQGSLTWAQQLRRADLDPPEHQYSDREAATADAREERGRSQRWDPDPFSYSDDRRDGPWPRVDQLEVLSNNLRMDPAYGYSPGGFARRLRQVPHRELIEERLPARARHDSAARLAWLLEAIEQEEASLRAALKLVLRERHGRLSQDDAGPTALAMAWCHVVASRCQLAALRELARESRAEVQRQRSQLTLF